MSIQLGGVHPDILKIDSAAANGNGSAGVENSIANRLAHIQAHIETYERWMEVAASPSGETNIADELDGGGGAFELDAGNDTWGSWVQILGSADTPIISGQSEFHIVKLAITAAERNAPYFIQIAAGASGAAALASGDYSSIVYQPVTATITAVPVGFGFKKQDSGTKVWARCSCPGQNTGTISFFYGLHEYGDL